VPVERRGERGHRLVGQPSFPPQPAGLVDELLELRGRRTEPARRSEGERVRPGQPVDFEHADALNQAIRLLSLRHRARIAALLAPLGVHPGQEALLLELARTGPRIQAQLSEALGCEPPSITLMTRKLEASGHIRRAPDPADKRASVVELTDTGRELTDRIRQLWCGLAEETVAGLPAQTVAQLPGILNAMTGNVDNRRHTRPPAEQTR
jgi:DNA-binding MarR family transcriptional regulator